MRSNSKNLPQNINPAADFKIQSILMKEGQPFFTDLFYS